MINITYRENYLRAAKLSYPKFVPVYINIFRPLWNIYGDKLKDVLRKYPMLFHNQNLDAVRYSDVEGTPFIDKYTTDAFGCVWRTRVEGYIGEVVRHPLDDWGKFDNFKLPDPELGVPTENGEPQPIIPWDKIFRMLRKAKERNQPIIASMWQHFFFLRLIYLRGFNNIIMDMYRRHEKLYKLIDMLTDYYISLIRIYKKGFNPIDIFAFADDLGAEDKPLISPRMFKEFIYPSYKKIYSEAKTDGSLVFLHSDGRTAELWDLLLDTGIDILYVQDKPNGLENILKLKERTCIFLDINRRLLAFGTPEEVSNYIKHVFELFKDPRGGFIIKLEFHPPAKLDTIDEALKTLNELVWFETT